MSYFFTSERLKLNHTDMSKKTTAATTAAEDTTMTAGKPGQRFGQGENVEEAKKEYNRKKRAELAQGLRLNNPEKYQELQQRRQDRAAQKAAKDAQKAERKAKGEKVEEENKEQREKEAEQEEAADDDLLGMKPSEGGESAQGQQQPADTGTSTATTSTERKSRY